MRIVIAGLLGGIATPLATAGLSTMPGEDRVLATLRAELGETRGLYFFPGPHGSDRAAMAAQEAKVQSGVSGLLAYNPPAAKGAFGRQLGVEFALEVVEAGLTAWIISAAVGFWSRWLIALGVGLIAAVTTNVSYWNWYGFSDAFTEANAFTELMKYVIAGAVAAAILGWRGRATSYRSS